MRTLLGYVAIASGMLMQVCQGQGLFDQLNFRSAVFGGARIYGVSVFSGYTDSSYFGSNVNYGGSFSAGWQHHRESTDMSILYSGTYGGLVRYPDLNSYDQALSIGASHKVAPKWTVSFSASGQDSSLANSLFQPSGLTVSSQLVGSFNDLAATFGLGPFSSTQVASMVPGASILDSPLRSALLGDRVLSYSGQASLIYSHSPRLSFHFGGFGAGGQHLSGGQNTVAPQNYIIPHSVGGNGGIGMSFSLSPRTHLGVDVEENLVHNGYQDAFTTTAMASWGRKMGERWFLSVHGGDAETREIQQTIGTARTRNLVGGGSLGFKTYTNTFVASYDRTASDTYGFAVGTITSLSGTWNWHRVGSRFSVFTSFGQQQARNAGFASFSGWQASGGCSESLGGNAQLTAQYVYLSNAANFVGAINNVSAQSVRLSMNWSPQPVRH
jgi:hypothetical protein